MILSSVSIQLSAVIAKPIASIASASFVLRYVAARRTRTVIVMDAMCRLLLNFVDGVKRCYWRHLIILLSEGVYKFLQCLQRR